MAGHGGGWPPTHELMAGRGQGWPPAHELMCAEMPPPHKRTVASPVDMDIKSFNIRDAAQHDQLEGPYLGGVSAHPLQVYDDLSLPARGGEARGEG